MLWYLPWSENIKKRACRYLLQRYLGNFLEEKLTLDQLSVDLYNGTGTVLDVSLDCEAINEVGDAQSWPFEVVDGYMQRITVSIPWSTLLKDDSLVEIHGLSIAVKPKPRNERGSSMLESMWSSMSSSMQLAAECLQQENEPTEAAPLEGIEMFAHAIDSVLSKVKVKLVDTKIRMEHIPKDSDSGIALEIHIKCIEYLDEAGLEPPPDLLENEKTKTYVVATFSSKRLLIDGVHFYTNEFPSKCKTMSRSVILEKSQTQKAREDCLNAQSVMSEAIFESCISYQSEPSQEESVHDSSPESHDSNESEPYSNEDKIRNEIILFGKLTGVQELILKMKLSPEATGSKIDMQLTFGSFILFLSPRQLHLLLTLANGLSSPQAEVVSHLKGQSGLSSGASKPMDAKDFQRVEAQLLGELVGGNQGSNLARRGWSSAHMDDSDNESEKFLPMQTASGSGTTSVLDCAMTDSCNSSASFTSSITLTSNHTPRNRRVPQIDGDPSAEVSHLNIKMASLTCLLLHKDLLVQTSSSEECLTQSSVDELKSLSEIFYDNIGNIAIGGYGNVDFDQAAIVFDKALDRSHLRLCAASLSLDACEKTTSQGCQTTGHISLAKAALRELLYFSNSRSESIDVITFVHAVQQSDIDANPLSGLPDVRVNFKISQKALKFAGEQKYASPAIEISVMTSECNVEADLRFYERVGAFHGNSESVHAETSTTPGYPVSFDVKCPKLNIVLRFPTSEVPLRGVRADVFKINATEVNVHNEPQMHGQTSVKILAQMIDVYYAENTNDAGVHIARTTCEEKTDCDMPDLYSRNDKTLPCITLSFRGANRTKQGFDSPSDEENSVHPSMFQSAFLMDKVRDGTFPSPFSSKKISHQSDTTHQQQSSIEELLVPGSASEMHDFMTHSSENSSIYLECDFPVLSAQLQSKQLYELIYNRINYDLLMWEPVIPDAYSTSIQSNRIDEPNIYPAFSLCKSGLDYASESESSSSEDDQDQNIFFSTYQKGRQSLSGVDNVSAPAHDFCFTLGVDKAMLTFYVPVRDSANQVVPMQMGEAVITGESLKLCSVNGVRGVYGTALLALNIETATLYHCDIIPETIEKPVKLLRVFGTPLPNYLLKTIYPSPKEARLKSGSSELMRLALSIEPHKDLSNFKLIKVGLEVEGATVRHRRQKGWWLMQLLDALDVREYGTSPPVLTELHAHLTDVSIDYRPLFLPTRAVVTLGTFSISSNVIANTNTSSLRFIAQECSLYLHEVSGYKPGDQVPQDDAVPVNLMKNYVCVMDLGLFELSLRLVDKVMQKNATTGPTIDIRASNNILNVRTCADSASALCRLIAYVAADSDRPPDDIEENPLDDIIEMSHSEVKQVNNMMEEAMEESVKHDLTSDNEDPPFMAQKEGVEVFFFPDESTEFHQKRSSISSETRSNSDTISLKKRGSFSSELDTEFNSSKRSSISSETRLYLDELSRFRVGSLSEDIVEDSETNENDKFKVNETLKLQSDSSDKTLVEDTSDPLSYINTVSLDETPIDKLVCVETETSAKKEESTETSTNVESLIDMTNEENNVSTESTKDVENIEDYLDTKENISNNAELHLEEDPIQKEINLHFAEEDRKRSETKLPLISQVAADLGDIQAELDEDIAKRQARTSEGGGSTDDEFCIIDGRSPQEEELLEPKIRWYQSDPVPFHSNHFTLPLGKTDVLRPPSNFPLPVVRYTLCDMTIVWHLYGGHDFKILSQDKSCSGKKVTVHEEFNTFSTVVTETDPYDVIPRSMPSPRARITYSTRRSTSASDRPTSRMSGVRFTTGVRPQSNIVTGASVARDNDLHVEIEFSKVKFLHESYPRETKQASRQTLAIGRVEVRDRVAVSSIDKFLSHYVQDESPSQTHANMVVMKAVHLRPNPALAMQECCIKVSLLPLRFHIDQDTLLFLIHFFSNLDPDPDSTIIEEKSPRRSSQQLPVMQVNKQQADTEEPLIEQYEAERLVSDNLIQLEEEFRSLGAGKSDNADTNSETSSQQQVDDAPIYFRRVVFSPDVAIRVDYVGKRVDLSQGPIAGLLLGLAHLNCSELMLKRLCHRHGILGVDKLIKWALGEWLSDIKRRQLPGLLGGIGPMHSFLQLLSGVRDLIWLPVAQWRADGRVAYGLRRGAASFSARAALAALDLTARLLAVVQAAAETALHVLSPAGTIHSTASHRALARRRRRRAAGGDLRAAAAGACAELRAGLAVQAGRVTSARGGAAVLRALPAAAVAPLALAAAASTDLLVAVRAHIAPDVAARNHKTDHENE